MGFALPGAIAADLVFPHRNILAICGDAGFLMNVQEMETARRLNSNIVVMVWEDHEYGLIAWKQESQFGRHTDLAFGNPDWMQLARSFGWNGHPVRRSGELKDALARAFAEEGPSLIVVPIDYRENLKLNQRLGELTVKI
jgi:acetolactate synthase-1/2/3 large subunit